MLGFFFPDLLMTEVVDCFVVGHWAVSHKLTERHVSRATTNAIEVLRSSSHQPQELYEWLITSFSKEGDLILDLGSGNGKLVFHCKLFQLLAIEDPLIRTDSNFYYIHDYF